jgi:L-ascorbate metabolism protein UlaG (beta-lactamase superfamily)
LKIAWLGHSGFRIEIEGSMMLPDAWLTGNPMFPAGRRAEAIAGATHVLITHGHGDHTGEAVGIASDFGMPVVGIYDLISQ